LFFQTVDCFKFFSIILKMFFLIIDKKRDKNKKMNNKARNIYKKRLNLNFK